MDNIQQLIKTYNKTGDKKLYNDILELIKTQETLWVAFSPVTKNYYLNFVNGSPTAFIFSEKEYYDAFQDYLFQQQVKVLAAENTVEDRTSMFGDFYRSGFESIIVDNGQTFLIAEISDIIEKPDFSSLPETERPVTNPFLVCAAGRFFQNLDAKSATRDMEYDMLVEIYKSKYLLAMNVENETNGIHEIGADGKPIITVAGITRSDGRKTIPFFTDWNELKKFNKDGNMKCYVASFEDIKHFCSNGELVTINPFGFNMVIDKNSAEIIESLAKNSVPENGERVTIFAIDMVPADMIDEMKKIFDHTDSIKSAYIRGMRKNGVKGYLVIVDFEGDKEPVFAAIAEKIKPYTKNLPVDFIKYNTELGKKAVGDSKPFYEKIKFEF